MTADALQFEPMNLSYQARNRTPLEIVRELAVVAAIAILLGVILPGIVAYESGVFGPGALRERVKLVHRDAEACLSRAEASREKAKEALAALDSTKAVDSTNRTGGVISLAELSVLRQGYLREIAEPLPISIQPYSSSIIVYFWAIMYFGLGTAIFVIGPSNSDVRRINIDIQVCRVALGIFIFAAGPLSIRALIFAGPGSGRTVYAWSNPDLSWPSFCMQLFNFAVFSLCLAIIWSQWSSFEVNRRAHAIEEPGNTNVLSIRSAQDLARLLYRWQVTFAAISSGFVVYTAIFWNQIVRNKDLRFGWEAIFAHVFWFVTIAITATPLVTAWRAWNDQKLKSIIFLLNETASVGDIEARITAVRDLQPIPGWNLIASAVAVLTSLAGPLLQALIK